MIWVLLFPLIPLILMLGFGYNNWPWWSSFDHVWVFNFDFWMPLILSFMMGGMLCIGAGALGFGLGRLIGDSTDCVLRQCWHAKLASLRNADGVEGHISGGIFLISGYIDSRQVYYYYTDEGNGVYKPHKWKPDDDTFVIEEDRTNGELFQYDTVFKKSWLDWIAIPNARLRMEFHIPKGSLKQQFKVE